MQAHPAITEHDLRVLLETLTGMGLSVVSADAASGRIVLQIPHLSRPTSA